jgi:phosphatidylserine decarboxylase
MEDPFPPLGKGGQGRFARLPLAREGYPLIVGCLVATGILFVIGWQVLTLVAVALTVFTVAFFRDPERVTPAGADLIVAPADGRVIKVAPVRDERFLEGEAMLVSIFMSPFNVHVNRAPVSGRVVDVRYTHGKYFRAFADKASLDNEQNAVLLEDGQGRRLGCVQIAGFLARRIVCYLRPGMNVERGQRYGMIKFGSRADVYLPPAAQIRVQVGDRARAGVTVLAQWP